MPQRRRDRTLEGIDPFSGLVVAFVYDVRIGIECFQSQFWTSDTFDTESSKKIDSWSKYCCRCNKLENSRLREPDLCSLWR